jgi:hypothetical protein
MLEALDDIVTYCGSGREAFMSDRMRQDATLRKLQVIGQAVKNLRTDEVASAWDRVETNRGDASTKPHARAPYVNAMRPAERTRASIITAIH